MNILYYIIDFMEYNNMLMLMFCKYNACSVSDLIWYVVKHVWTMTDLPIKMADTCNP